MNNSNSSCPACGAAINIGDNKCVYCSAEFKSTVTKGKVDLKSRACPFCKHNSDANEEYCRSCGNYLRFKCPQCSQENFMVAQYCNNCGEDIALLSQGLINKDFVSVASIAESLSEDNIDSGISVFRDVMSSKSFDSEDESAALFLLKFSQTLNKKYLRIRDSSAGSLTGSIYAEQEQLVKIILASGATQSIKDQAQSLLISREEKSAKEECFVVTATMGNRNHPIVIDLQEFRDEYLLERNWGRYAVSVYNNIGPRFANIIENNALLIFISRTFIILPSRMISKILYTRQVK